jgi:hypothetical protein
MNIPSLTKAVLGAILFSLGRVGELWAQGELIDLRKSPDWYLAFSDEFDGTGSGSFNSQGLDTTKWLTTPGSLGRGLETAYVGWGSEYYPQDDPSLLKVSCETDPADATAVGVLHLTARPLLPAGTSYPGGISSEQAPRTVRYKSALIRTTDAYNLPSYGAYEMRARFPAAFAAYQAWPTFWLWSCPTEIDIVDGGDVRADAVGFLTNVVDNEHSPRPCVDKGKAGKHITPYSTLRSDYGVSRPTYGLANCPFDVYIRNDSTRPGRIFIDQYNTYTMVWTPQQVTFFFNGRLVQTVFQAEVTTQPHWPNLIASLQMYPGASTTEPATLDIDYIRIYKTTHVSTGVPDYRATPVLRQPGPAKQPKGL